MLRVEGDLDIDQVGCKREFSVGEEALLSEEAAPPVEEEDDPGETGPQAQVTPIKTVPIQK